MEAESRPRRTCAAKQLEKSRKELAKAELASMDQLLNDDLIFDKDLSSSDEDTRHEDKFGDSTARPFANISNGQQQSLTGRATVGTSSSSSTSSNNNNTRVGGDVVNSQATSVGRDMYSFGCTQSPSVKVATAGCRTPSARNRRVHLDPSTPMTRTPSKRVAGTPSVHTPGRLIRAGLDAVTPHSTRRKIASRLGKFKEETLNNQEDSEDSDDEDVDRDEDDDVDDDLLENNNDEADAGIDYFSQTTRRKQKDEMTTSDHTLAKLGAAMLSEEQIAAILKKGTDRHAKHRRKIVDKLKKDFPFWLQLTLEGSNLLLYGLGSKVGVINELMSFLDKESFTTMLVNGFLPTCNLQEIITNILEYVIEERPKGVIGFQAQVEFIRSYFSRPEAVHLYVLVNSIDAPSLTSPKVLQAFEVLASAPQIHFIGTVNHINAPLLWDLNRASTMRWVWADCTTYEPYTLELTSDTLKSSAANTLSSLEHVFASLTTNAKKVFLIIAKYTLEHASDGATNFHGLPFQDCYRMCREAFVVNSDLTLRTQLTEFVDHDMIRIKKGHDGVEYLVIPLAIETLEIFVQQQDDDM